MIPFMLNDSQREGTSMPSSLNQCYSSKFSRKYSFPSSSSAPSFLNVNFVDLSTEPTFGFNNIFPVIFQFLILFIFALLFIVSFLPCFILLKGAKLGHSSNGNTLYGSLESVPLVIAKKAWGFKSSLLSKGGLDLLTYGSQPTGFSIAHMHTT